MGLFSRFFVEALRQGRAACVTPYRWCFALMVLLDQASPTSREYHNGNSGSRRALRLAVVAEAEVVERTKLQRIEAACRESCRITIWAVRRGPSLPARNTLSSSSTLSSSASKVQTSRLGNTSMTPRASESRLALTEGCRWNRNA